MHAELRVAVAARAVLSSGPHERLRFSACNRKTAVETAALYGACPHSAPVCAPHFAYRLWKLYAAERVRLLFRFWTKSGHEDKSKVLERTVRPCTSAPRNICWRLIIHCVYYVQANCARSRLLHSSTQVTNWHSSCLHRIVAACRGSTRHVSAAPVSQCSAHGWSRRRQYGCAPLHGAICYGL